VAGAVMLSAVLNHPEKAEEKHKAFLGLGSEIAAGTRRWK
jgi:hypothetical protein